MHLPPKILQGSLFLAAIFVAGYSIADTDNTNVKGAGVGGSGLNIGHGFGQINFQAPEEISTTDWNITLLPVGYSPLDLSRDGRVVLLTEGNFNYIRWSAGSLEYLGTGHKGLVNNDGAIAFGTKDSLDVRRPVIKDVALNSDALQLLNLSSAVANLPARILYSEIVFDRVPLGVLVLGSYSVFDGITGVVSPLSVEAQAFILGTDGSGHVNPPTAFYGDGLVPTLNATFTDLQGFQGRYIERKIYSGGTVVHTDEPAKRVELDARLHALIGW